MILLFFVLTIGSMFNGVGCMDTYNDELNHYDDLNSRFELLVKNLSAKNPNLENSIRTSLMDDELGDAIKLSKKCILFLSGGDLGIKDNNFNYLIGVFIAIPAAVIGFLGAEYIKGINASRKGKNSIKNQILELSDTLNSGARTFTANGVSIPYVNQYFSTTVFDGIVSSGTFIYFPQSLQLMFDKFYFHLTRHNTTFKELEQFMINTQSQQTPSTIISSTALDLITQLSLIEIDLRDKLQEIKKLL